MLSSDSQHGWTWQSTWLGTRSAAGTVLVRTSDGVRTRYQVTMPPIDARPGVKIYEINHDTFVAETHAQGVNASTAFWLPKDGGATGTPSAATDPPVEPPRSQPLCQLPSASTGRKAQTVSAESAARTGRPPCFDLGGEG
jgi:hypothetical protein